jgi:hypothetical protein
MEPEQPTGLRVDEQVPRGAKISLHNMRKLDRGAQTGLDFCRQRSRHSAAALFPPCSCPILFTQD